ncbi:MAG: ISAs1 family transposase [Candidatus Symbiodolus clandestinus]
MDLRDKCETFLDFISGIEDHRVERRKVHPVAEIFLVTLATVICGAEGWIDIETFGKSKLEFLRQFIPFTYGIPADDTLRRFFRALDSKVFQESFIRWVQSLQSSDILYIAIDGKVSRRTFDGDNNRSVRLPVSCDWCWGKRRL